MASGLELPVDVASWLSTLGVLPALPEACGGAVLLAGDAALPFETGLVRRLARGWEVG